MIHDRIPSEHRAVRQMQRAWDIPKIAVCTDSGCACYSLKSQYPQNCGMFPRGILKGIGCVQSPSNLFFIKLHLLQLIAHYHTCMKQNDAKQPGHLTAQAVCSAGRTYSCQESIEECPLFQGCRSSLAELAINHSK